MRELLGWLVLIGGLIGLGAWGYSYNAHEIEAKIASNAVQAIGVTVHPVNIETHGRDILVSGLVDSQKERDTIVSRLNLTSGRRVVVDDLRVLEVASPYVFFAEKIES